MRKSSECRQNNARLRRISQVSNGDCGGFEWMFLNRWSAKAECLYLDTGTTNVKLFRQLT